MRTKEEIEEAFRKVVAAVEKDEDEEMYQAIYDTLRWFDGNSDFDNTIGQYLPD